MDVKSRNERSWWMDAKIYELYVDKFAGDFKGLADRLDYFNHLGINTLHILPHYPSPMVDGGYDVTDYHGVRRELGTLEDFLACVEKAHRRGIMIMTDLVLNHVSCEHPWFKEASASKNNSRRDFFLWSDTGRELKGVANLFPDIKDSNWIWNSATQDYYFASFYPQQVDLNWDNPNVLAEILHRMDFWIEHGVDGFRLDAVAHLVKREGTPSQGLPETHDIIRAIRKHLDDIYGGRIALLAEIGQNVEESKKYFGNGDECHMVYHFSLTTQLFFSLMRRDSSFARDMARNSFNIPYKCQWATFLRNHDDIALGLLPESDRLELLDFLDSERQYVFNKGQTTCMRLGSIFANEPERLLDAFELLYSLPGAPIMYYGDEIGTKNLPVQTGIVDSRKYVRGKFDWRVAENMLADPNSLLKRTARIIQHTSATS